MGKIFYIMGKSASGKDTIYHRLITDRALHREMGAALDRIVPYTTRPIRDGETEGVEYHFVTEQRRAEMDAAGKIIEQRTYQTVYGPWTYFTADDGLRPEEDSYLVIGTLEGFISMRNYFGADRIVPLYITLDDGERLQRALDRERSQKHPGYEEMCRRFLADQRDFSPEKLRAAGIDREYVNDRLEICIKEIASSIKQAVNP